MTPADEVPEVALLTRQLERERRARRSAEDIGEAATADLWQAVRRLEAAEAELRADAAHRETAERVLGFYSDSCPLYRSLKAALAITSELSFVPE